MNQAIKGIRKPGHFFIGDDPSNLVTKIVFSKNKYNQGANIDAKLWAAKAAAAIKANDRKAIKDLAQYGYAWFGTDKATDIPEIEQRYTYKDRTSKKKDNRALKAFLWSAGGAGTFALATLGLGLLLNKLR